MRRSTMIIVAAFGAVGTAVAGPAGPAGAAPPDTSAIVVSPTTVAPGELLTITQEIHNPTDFTVAAAKAAIYGQERPIVDVAEVVSCTGTIAPCYRYLSSYRAPVGDLPAGQTRTVRFTLRVNDAAEPGELTLRHQHVGDNYAFEERIGPALTITGTPSAADLAVRLAASPRGVLTSRVEYAITVTNTGPSDASGVRVRADYPAGLRFASSADCVRLPDSRSVACDLASLPAGASATVRFRVTAGLLALGSLTTTAYLVHSTPADPNPANDEASRTCTALTGLLVRC